MDADGLIRKIRSVKDHHANILHGIEIEAERIKDLQSAIASMLPE